MRDLFFILYGNGISWLAVSLLLLLVGLVLLLLSIIKVKNKTCKIISILISILLMYQIIPTAVNFAAQFSLINSNNNGNISYDAFKKAEKIEKIAINLSVIPWQKGVYYCELANYYFMQKDGKNQIKSFDKAFRYIRSYKYKRCWVFAPFAYSSSGDYETAIKIADELKFYYIASQYSLVLNENNKALEYMDKAIASMPNKSVYYGMRAYVYNKLGKHEEEKADIIKARSLAKSDKELKSVEKYHKSFREIEIERQKRVSKELDY